MNNRTWPGFPLMALCLGLAISLLPVSGHAQATQPGTYAVFPLQFVETGLQAAVNLGNRDVKFLHEPGFGKDKVFRSALKVGPGTNDFMGFAVDLTRRVLYLDLDRNLDLTDDPAGVHQGRGAGNSAQFTKIRVNIGNRGMQRSYCLDMFFYREGLNAIYVTSSYRGEIELNGRKWQLIVQDNLDGVIDRHDRFAITPASASRAAYDSMPAAENLFLGDREYQLGFTFGAAPGAAPLSIAFTEKTVPSGELVLDGRFIQRLVLDGPGLVILDTPASRISLPVGKYRVQKIYLQSSPGDLQVTSDGNALPEFSVAAGTPQHVKLGGPVESSVRTTASGNVLQLDYFIKGAGGESYGQVTSNRSNPPQFAIFKGSRKVAEGDFEFG